MGDGGRESECLDEIGRDGDFEHWAWQSGSWVVDRICAKLSVLFHAMLHDMLLLGIYFGGSLVVYIHMKRGALIMICRFAY